MRGIPIRTDGGPKAIFEDNSTWSMPLYSCATASRASIKTVDFSVTGAGGLDSLQVNSIDPKEYASEDDYPIWGTEDSGLRMTEIPMIWGLLSPEYTGYPNVSTIKQPSFYLPGYASNGIQRSSFTRSPVVLYQNLPGHDFAVSVGNTVYGSGISGLGDSWPIDVLGRGNLGVFARWSDLLRNSNANTIIDLIWTDLAASAVVGTKGTLGPGNNAAEAAEAPVIMIQPIVRRVRYHLPFGIPAFILLLVVILVCGMSLLTLLTHRSIFSLLRLRIQQLSIGRVFTTILYPDRSSFTMSPKEWSQAVGKRTVTLDGIGPSMGHNNTQAYVVVDEKAVTQSTPLNSSIQGDSNHG